MAADIGVAAFGNLATAWDDELRAEGETTPIVRYTVQTLVAGTNTPLTAIVNGRDFDVRVVVQDLRNDGNINRGVYAGYLDLLYEKTLGRVRVLEVQTLEFSPSAPPTGSFTLTLNPGQTTAPINYSLIQDADVTANAALIQTALNNLLGAGAVRVTQLSPVQAIYEIRFTGLADVDHPTLQPSANVTVTETLKGNPTLPESFIEAFRSRDLGIGGGVPGPYQNGLSAINAIDRVEKLGAFATTARTGTGIRELVRARMTATLPANQSTRVLTFTPDFSQLVLAAHATQVFADLQKPCPGNPTQICPEDQNVPFTAVVSVAASLTITTALSAATGVAQVEEDNPAGINIPILPLVTKNSGAPAGAIELRSFTQPAAGGTVQRLDPNNTPTNFSDDLVRFIPAADFFGDATFTYTAGIVGDPIPLDEATSSVTVRVTAVNDAPVNTVPGQQTTVEDTNLIFSVANANLIRVSDIDADPEGVRVTLAVSAGALTLSGITGLTFTLGDGTADSILTFSGTTTLVNAALAGLTYHPAPNSTATATLTITTSDVVANGSGGLKQDQDAVSIAITGTNDPPSVTAPAAQAAFTLNTLVFSPAFGNAIVVSDIDAGNDSITVTLAAAGGIGTLTATAAAGAAIGGNGTANMSISGSQNAINATLSGLTLIPSSGAATGTLTIVANDQGRNPGPALTGQAVVNITVSVPTGPFAVSDTPLGLVEGSASYTIDVLANDLVTSGNAAVIVSFTQPQVGSVSLDNNGTPANPTDDKLVYRAPLKNGLPDLDFFTPASLPPIGFTYVANQSPGASSTNPPPGSVSLRIANAPDVPVANNDGLNNSYATSIGASLSRTAAQGLLVNDTSVDNNYGDANVAVLTVLGASAGKPAIAPTAAGGTVTVNVDGSFSYTPAAGFGGNDTFTYRAHSSLGPDSAPATVTIHVSAPPHGHE